MNTAPDMAAISEPETPRLDTTLREKARLALRDAILDGRLKAGEKLVERELCVLTGASRSALREALVLLETGGLIERQSYRGYRVAKLSTQKIFEIFELRAALETLVAELFTERASDQEIADLNDALTDLEQCLTDFDLQRMRTVKEVYYEILFTGCRNVEIRRSLENVIDRIYHLRSHLMNNPDRREASLQEMRRLTAALTSRDRLAARAASLSHLTAARDAVLNLMAES